MLLKIKKHKLMFVTTVFLIFAIITVSATLGFQYAVTDSLDNTFDLGEITTEIKEETSVGNSVINKNPRVENDGPNDALIRMRVNISPSIVKQYLENKIDYNNDETSYDSDNDNDNAFWVYNKDDGFWYYNRVVKKNNSTEPLFTKITGVVDENGKITDDFKKLIGNDDDFEITLYQEAVQTVVYGNNGEIYSENGIKADVSSLDYIDVSSDRVKLIWSLYNKTLN